MDRYNFKIVEEKWQKYWSKNNSFKSKIDKNKKIPKELISKLAENGFLGIFVPEEYGGSGMDYVSY